MSLQIHLKNKKPCFEIQCWKQRLLNLSTCFVLGILPQPPGRINDLHAVPADSCCFASIICVAAEILCIIFLITNCFAHSLIKGCNLPHFFFCAQGCYMLSSKSLGTGSKIPTKTCCTGPRMNLLILALKMF